MSQWNPEQDVDLPFVIGALYSRQDDIHKPFGGQAQGGISTPAKLPLIIAFTGQSGEAHGYSDFWEDDHTFHYYGEGQVGDMEFERGNRAIRDHVKDGKRLILFQMLGKGQPYRYRGEFACKSYYLAPNTPDSQKNSRTAIVFRLHPLEREEALGMFPENEELTVLAIESTVSRKLIDVRNAQTLFRRRLLTVESQCRLTGIRDTRFLRASHIKPWAKCETGDERIDGHNGLLLAAHADHLFDSGWISFQDNGRLIVSSLLPTEVRAALRISLDNGQKCGTFVAGQMTYLSYHRDMIFERWLRTQAM